MVEDYIYWACEVRISGAPDFLVSGKAVKIRHGPAHCEQPKNLSQMPLSVLCRWEGGIGMVASQETCHKPEKLFPSWQGKEVKDEKKPLFSFNFY